MLEVDNRVILPELTHVRFIITSADVIQEWVRFYSMDLKSGKYAASLLPFFIFV
jgi:cytochrome c oxidase subunit 2